MNRLFMIVCLIVSLPISSFALSDKGYDKLNTFTKVLDLVEKNYVEQIDEDELIDGAIRGMMSTLDPHSAYLVPEMYKEIKVGTEGKFDGVGLEVTIRNNKLTVVAPLKGTPAEKAGLKSSDIITKIDGRSTDRFALLDCVEMMRGKRGSKVVLTVSREGMQKPFEVELTRQKVVVPSVTWDNIDGYGYVAISSFQQGTSNDVKNALQKLKGKGDIKGLILDLRHNPGGLFDEAVKVSDIFLDKGTVVSSSARGKEFDRREAASGAEPYYPMIVIIDGGSASASEIVAGALQDQKRAFLLGEPSFGKGSLQTIFDLEDGSALKLTVGKYYTPSGKSIQAQGIKPDIEVSSKSPEEVKKAQVRESDLSGHLPSETDASKGSVDVKVDRQKDAALTYLKSWDTFSKGLLEREKDHQKKNKDVKSN